MCSWNSVLPYVSYQRWEITKVEEHQSVGTTRSLSVIHRISSRDDNVINHDYVLETVSFFIWL